ASHASSSSGVSGPHAGICTAMCDNLEAIDCAVPADCAASCVTSIEAGGACNQVLVDYIACLAAHPSPGCQQHPAACEEPYAAWRACPLQSGCGPVVCTERNNQDCTCSALCSGAEYEETCFTVDGEIACECRVDGELEVVCSGDELLCAFFAGCCSLV